MKLFLLILVYLFYLSLQESQKEKSICRDPDLGSHFPSDMKSRKYLLIGGEGAGIGNFLIFFPAAFYFAALTGREILILDNSLIGEMCKIVSCGFPHYNSIAAAFPNILNSETFAKAERAKVFDFYRHLNGEHLLESTVLHADGYKYMSGWYLGQKDSEECVMRITGCEREDIACHDRHALQRLIRGPFLPSSPLPSSTSSSSSSISSSSSSSILGDESRIIGIPSHFKHGILTLPHAFAPRLDAAVHLRCQFQHFEYLVGPDDANWKNYVLEVKSFLESKDHNKGIQLFEILALKIMSEIDRIYHTQREKKNQQERKRLIVRRVLEEVEWMLFPISKQQVDFTKIENNNNTINNNHNHNNHNYNNNARKLGERNENEKDDWIYKHQQETEKKLIRWIYGLSPLPSLPSPSSSSISLSSSSSSSSSSPSLVLSSNNNNNNKKEDDERIKIIETNSKGGGGIGGGGEEDFIYTSGDFESNQEEEETKGKEGEKTTPPIPPTTPITTPSDSSASVSSSRFSSPPPPSASSSSSFSSSSSSSLSSFDWEKSNQYDFILHKSQQAFEEEEKRLSSFSHYDSKEEEGESKNSSSSTSHSNHKIFLYLSSDNEIIKEAFATYLLSHYPQSISIMRIKNLGQIVHAKNVNYLKSSSNSTGLMDLVLDWYALSLSNFVFAWRRDTDLLSTFAQSAQRVSGNTEHSEVGEGEGEGGERKDRGLGHGIGSRGFQLLFNKHGQSYWRNF